MEESIKAHIISSYRITGYHKPELAVRLGVTLKTVYNYAKKYNLDEHGNDFPSVEEVAIFIKPLDVFVDDYLKRSYRLCNYNKSKLTTLLGISVKTIQSMCKRLKLDENKKIKLLKKVIPKEYTSKDFFCMQPVTQEQRDSWYNRDYF